MHVRTLRNNDRTLSWHAPQLNRLCMPLLVYLTPNMPYVNGAKLPTHSRQRSQIQCRLAPISNDPVKQLRTVSFVQMKFDLFRISQAQSPFAPKPQDLAHDFKKMSLLEVVKSISKPPLVCRYFPPLFDHPLSQTFQACALHALLAVCQALAISVPAMPCLTYLSLCAL